MSDHDKRPADHILFGIHIGPIEDVAESTTDYDNIISVCQDNRFDNVPETIPYYHVKLADDEHSEDEWGGSASYETFESAVHYLRHTHSMLYGESDTLVHCHNGKNRSVAVVAAYLAVRYGLFVAEAIELIRAKRPIADPNDLMRSHAKRYFSENVGTAAP